MRQRECERQAAEARESEERRRIAALTPLQVPNDVLVMIRNCLDADRGRLLQDMMDINPKHVPRETVSRGLLARQRAAGRALASCAAVNRQWQAVFEVATFRHVTVGSADLHKFEVYFAAHMGRRQHLRWLQLRLAQTWIDPALRPPQRRSFIIFEFAMRRLLEILSKWAPEDTAGDGITFEASVVDSTQPFIEFDEQEHLRRWHELASVDAWLHRREVEDREQSNWLECPNVHWVHDVWYGDEVIEMAPNPREVERLLQKRKRKRDEEAKDEEAKDEEEGKKDQPSLLSDTAWLTLLPPPPWPPWPPSPPSPPSSPPRQESGRSGHGSGDSASSEPATPWTSLPTVGCVRHFVLARDSCYPLSPSRTLLPLLAAFPRLETMRYEPWFNSGVGYLDFCLELTTFLLESLSRQTRLRFFSLFLFHYGHWSWLRPSTPAFPLVPRALVKAGSRLEAVHIAFAVDAIQFFLETLGADAVDEHLDDRNAARVVLGDDAPFMQDMSPDGIPRMVARSRATWTHAACALWDTPDNEPTTWHNLRALTLSSRHLDQVDGSYVIGLAARAARYMPRLERLEIFGNTVGDHRVFRYERPSHAPRRPARLTYYTMSEPRWPLPELLDDLGLDPVGEAELYELLDNAREDNRISAVRRPQILHAWRRVGRLHWPVRIDEPAYHLERMPHVRIKTVRLQHHDMIGDMAFIKLLRNKECLFACHASLASTVEDASWTNFGRSFGPEHDRRRQERTERRNKARLLKAGGEEEMKKVEDAVAPAALQEVWPQDTENKEVPWEAGWPSALGN